MIQSLFKLKRLFLICFGVLIGIFAVFSWPTILVLGLSIYVIHIFRKDIITLEEQRFVTRICILALGIRIVISLFLFFGGKYRGIGSDAIGDARTYEAVGAYIKELASGVPIRSGLWDGNLIIVDWLRKVWPTFDTSITTSMSGFYTIPIVSYWYGYFYILWGLSFLALKILNGLLWIIGSYWLYLFFRERFTKIGTKFGLIITLFLPSFLFFSSSGLKDSLVFFLLMAIIFSSHMLERLHHKWYAISVLLVTFLLNKLSTQIGLPRISFFLISILVISFILVIWNNKYWLFWGLLIVSSSLLLPELRQRIHSFALIFGLCMLMRNINIKKVFIRGFLIIILSTIILGKGFWSNLYSRFQVQLKKEISTSVLQSYNTAYSTTAYHVYPERFYADIESRGTITYTELFISYLNGLRYVFFEPVPWKFKTLLGVAMFPETLFMWFFTPFIILGTIIILRINIRMALVTILFLFVMTSLLCLGQGNIGTLVRIRAMIMPWYFMIGALGLSTAYACIFKPKNNLRS